MKLTIVMNLDNDAYQVTEGYTQADVKTRITVDIMLAMKQLDVDQPGKRSIRDGNGNTVGQIVIGRGETR